MDPRMLFMLAFMLLLFWGVSRLSRSQQRKMQAEQERRTDEALVPGNWVRTRAGFYGTVVEVSGDRAVINKDESGRYAIMSPVKTSALAVAGTKPAEDYRIHTVVHGDTLWGIAKTYLASGARYTEIVKINGLKSSVIYTGQKLKIPQK